MKRPSLTVYRGKAYECIIAFTDEQGNPEAGFDAELNTYRAMIRRTLDSPVLASFTCDPITAYEVRLTLTEAQTALLVPSVCVCDLGETPPGGEESIVLDFDVLVEGASTRD